MARYEAICEYVGVVQVYAPRSALVNSLLEYAKLFGGCTITDGIGLWQPPDTSRTFIQEPVHVYTYVGYRAYAYPELRRLGEAFLQDNPNEECFLATLTEYGDRIYQVKITRKD